MYKENYTLIQVDRTITVDMAYYYYVKYREDLR